MRRAVKTLIVVLALFSINVSTGHACTVMRFDFGGRLLVARNHDWFFGEGMLIVNQPRIRKKGISPVMPLTWVSKYGSVSFVQFGRELPFAGMNQQGLTVDLLQLPGARFPAPSNQRSVNVVQWVQFQLDTASSVEEVVKSLDRVRPAPMLASIEKVHYFITDASGDVAIIEYLDGKPVVYRGAEATQCALANSTLKRSCKMVDAQRRNGSEQRFAKAVQSVQKTPRQLSRDEQVNYGFKSLRAVAQGSSTRWSIVYDPKEKRLWFQTEAAPQRRWIDLDDLSFADSAPTLMVDVNSEHTGNLASQVQPFQKKANQRLVDFAFGTIMPDGLAQIAIKQLVVGYPDTLERVSKTEPVTVEQ